MPNQQIQLSDAITSTSTRFPDAEGRCPVAVMKVGRLRFLQDLLGGELDQFSPNTVRLAVDGVYGGLTPKDQRELQALAEVVAGAGAPLARLGKGSTFAGLVRKVRDAVTGKVQRSCTTNRYP